MGAAIRFIPANEVTLQEQGVSHERVRAFASGN